MADAKSIDGIEILYRKAESVEKSGYPGLKEESYVLAKGSVNGKEVIPLACDIQVDRDVSVTLRDGAVIRLDVYRPVDREDCPVIMWWAPYGKRGAGFGFDSFGHEQRMDVPRRWEDGLHAFEAPLPAYWVAHGYAVVQADPRGAYGSEGDIHAWGTEDARDCCDVIAFLADQPWSNGKVGLSGNSWLAMTQYTVAAEQPPALAAIAPWEGASDLYRHFVCKGGIPYPTFQEALTVHLPGHGLIEDMPAMIERHPLYNAYWEDKSAKLERITTPAYIVASWTSMIHTDGTFQAWERIASTDKWLRVHDTMEWPDYLTPAHMDDLRLFFDHYLKGVANAWPQTPRVRLSVLDPGNRDLVNRIEQEFPLARQQVRALHLGVKDGLGVLTDAPAAEPAELSYDAEGRDELVFGIRFDEPVELTGHFNLKLFVEARGADDMDVFAHIRKRDVHGEIRQAVVVTGRTHVGPNGCLRVSLREVDPARSPDELRPFLPFERAEKLKPGEVVPVDVPFWPHSMRWSAGETLELVITPYNTEVRSDFPEMPLQQTLNKGRHVLHLGGGRDARLLVPFIPLP